MKRSNENSVIVGILPFYYPPNGATYFRPWAFACVLSIYDILLSLPAFVATYAKVKYIWEKYRSSWQRQEKGICGPSEHICCFFTLA